MVLKTDNLRINVTLTRVRVNVVAVEKQSVLHIMCEHLVTQNAMPFFSPHHYFIPWGLSGSSIFFAHYHKNGNFFGGGGEIY
jgi:hypothetical protein